MGTQLPPKKRGNSNSPPQFSSRVCCGQMAGLVKMPLGTEIGIGPGHIVLHGDPSPQKRAQPPIFVPCLLWPNGWTDQDATWYEGRRRPRRYCVRWGPSPPNKKGHSPQFSSHVCCGQMAGLIKMPLGTEVGIGPGHIVLHGDPALRKRAQPQFLANVYCGQTAGWSKMPLYHGVRLRPRPHCA